MSLNQLLSILKARWVVLSSVLFLTIATAVVVSLLLPKQYTAEAAVVIDVKSPDPIAGMVLPGMMTPGYMATQRDVIESERVAQKVIRALKLSEVPQIQADWKDDTDGKGDYQSWLAKLIQKKLDVKPSRESNVISIEYTSADPNFAAALANAFVQAYIDTTVELRVEPARQYKSLFDAQAKQVRDQLEAAQAKLSAYQREKGLVATDERLDVENASLVELSQQLVLLRSLSAESQSRKAQAGANSTEVLNNPVVAGLKADVSRQEARLKELSAKLGPAHPQVIEAQANISEMQSKINTEIGRVTSSFGISNSVNYSREAQVRSALEAQRQKILRLKEQRDEATVLLRDVENAQRAYELIQARLSQTSLESQSNQTNVSLLKQATAPSDASSPKIFLNIALAIFMGGLLAVSSAYLLEMSDRRLRTLEDVKNVLNSPFLGSIPRSERLAGPMKMPALLKAGKKNPELAAPAL